MVNETVKREDRDPLWIRLSIYYELSSLVLIIVAFFDDQGSYYWRLTFFGLAVYTLIDLILDLGLLYGIDSLKHLLTYYTAEDAKKSGIRYLPPATVDKEIEEMKELIAKEKEAIKKEPSFFQKITRNKPEAMFAITIGFLYSMTFFPVYYGLTLILTTEDLDNDSEVRLT